MPLSQDAASGTDNAGGGGGYYGGGAGGEDTSDGMGGGGGGGSAFAHGDVSSSAFQTAVGGTPFDDSDNDRSLACDSGSGNAAVGALGGASNVGNGGCVVVCWSSSCTSGL